jgi:zinc protease
MTALVQRRDQPDAVAGVVADLVLFGPGHPYGRPVAGWPRTVQAIAAPDLRQFYEGHWRPNNAALIVAGAFEPARLKPLLQAALGGWAAKPVPPVPAAPAAAPDRPRFVLVDKPGAPQTVLRLVGPGAARSSPDRPGLSLLATVLGGSFTSRLNANLRERNGYTYGAAAGFAFLRQPGAFSARSSVFTKVTDAALGEMFKEIAALTAAPVTADELGKAQAILQQRLAQALATTSGTAESYADIVLYGLPLDEPRRFANKLAAARPPALERLARAAVVRDALTVVAVGDRQAIETGLRAQGLPAPELRDADGDVRPAAPSESKTPVKRAAPNEGPSPNR